MSESALALAGHDFGLGDIAIPPERCLHCGERQPETAASKNWRQPETD